MYYGTLHREIARRGPAGSVALTCNAGDFVRYGHGEDLKEWSIKGPVGQALEWTWGCCWAEPGGSGEGGFYLLAQVTSIVSSIACRGIGVEGAREGTWRVLKEGP